MGPRTRTVSALFAASLLATSLSGMENGLRRGRGCCQSVESIRRGVAKRRAARAAKNARKRNRP